MARPITGIGKRRLRECQSLRKPAQGERDQPLNAGGVGGVEHLDQTDSRVRDRPGVRERTEAELAMRAAQP